MVLSTVLCSTTKLSIPSSSPWEVTLSTTPRCLMFAHRVPSGVPPATRSIKCANPPCCRPTACAPATGFAGCPWAPTPSVQPATSTASTRALFTTPSTTEVSLPSARLSASWLDSHECHFPTTILPKKKHAYHQLNTPSIPYGSVSPNLEQEKPHPSGSLVVRIRAVLYLILIRRTTHPKAKSGCIKHFQQIFHAPPTVHHDMYS